MKLSIFIILIPTPDFPHFYYMLGGNLGSLLYGDVSVMELVVLLSFTGNYVVSIRKSFLFLWVLGKAASFIVALPGPSI